MQSRLQTLEAEAQESEWQGKVYKHTIRTRLFFLQKTTHCHSIISTTSDHETEEKDNSG